MVSRRHDTHTSSLTLHSYFVHMAQILILFYNHCMKSVKIRSFFRSVFSCIRTENGDLRSKSPHSVRIQENMDEKKLRIWIIFRSEYYTKWLQLVLWSNVSCSHFFQDWSFVSLLVPQYTNCIYIFSGVHQHIPTVIDIRYYLHDSSPPPSWTKFIKINMRICIYRVHIFKRSFINPISLSQSKY